MNTNNGRRLRLPTADRHGNYPAAESLTVLMARQILQRRKALGLSQRELAERAGVRNETLCRLETGKHAPTTRTIDKIDRALSAEERRSSRPRKRAAAKARTA
jgi:transcriptional regulator with XRE-family HTH domain